MKLDTKINSVYSRRDQILLQQERIKLTKSQAKNIVEMETIHLSIIENNSTHMVKKK